MTAEWIIGIVVSAGTGLAGIAGTYIVVRAKWKKALAEERAQARKDDNDDAKERLAVEKQRLKIELDGKLADEERRRKSDLFLAQQQEKLVELTLAQVVALQTENRELRRLLDVAERVQTTAGNKS